MSGKYRVTVEVETPSRKKKRTLEFRADPKLKNVWLIELEPHRFVRVEIKPHRWWQR